MQKVISVIIFISITPFLFSQIESEPTKIYGNDSLYSFLNTTPEKIKIGDNTFFTQCNFTHQKMRRGKAKPYYWNSTLKCSGKSTLPASIKQEKLYILSDTAIYEFAYIPESLCWNKTNDVYQKPMAVIIEFLDTSTNTKYYVRAKGPFSVKH
jgi:hypothetical protein